MHNVFYTCLNFLKKEFILFEFNTNMQLCLIDTTCKLKKLFPYKDKQPHLQQFDVIYQLKYDC